MVSRITADQEHLKEESQRAFESLQSLARIEVQKEQQAKEELVGCTFQPQLINNHLYPQVNPQVMNLAGMVNAAYH